MTQPKVGMGATLVVGSDDYPYTVTEVFWGGVPVKLRRVIIQEDDWILLKGSAFNGSAVYDYIKNPNGKKLVVTLRRDGHWRVQNGLTPVYFGDRRYYRDPSF